MIRYLEGLRIGSKILKIEPSHIPATNLCKAELMRTELLI